MTSGGGMWSAQWVSSRRTCFGQSGHIKNDGVVHVVSVLQEDMFWTERSHKNDEWWGYVVCVVGVLQEDMF